METGTVKANSVDVVTNVAVAGVVAEYLKYGSAEGGLNDILQLDGLMRSLRVGFRAALSRCGPAMLVQGGQYVSGLGLACYFFRDTDDSKRGG